VTPKRTSMSAVSTPASTTTTASDMSDDMPMTPKTPAYSSDPFSSSDDKENISTFEPVLNKLRLDNPPEQYLPHDFVSFGRPALHSLNNISSPRMALVS